MRKYILILFCLFYMACSREIIITEEQLKQDLLYLTNDIRPFSGTCNILFKDTSLVKEHFSFKDGTLHGVSCSYFKYGNLKWKGEYKEGKMSGKWEFWNEDGIKHCETHFKDDNYHGPYISWHENGKTKETGQYENNRKTGTWTVYNDSGKVLSQYNY